jgi:hypothetical protein
MITHTVNRGFPKISNKRALSGNAKLSHVPKSHLYYAAKLPGCFLGSVLDNATNNL